MLAFAGNSVLCRLALDTTAIDPASFTSLRLISGAAVLWLLVTLRGGGAFSHGSWPSALALFAYAAGFSWAYIHLDAGLGALLLFAAVQVTMIGTGVARGERLTLPQQVGMTLALLGLIALLLPGSSAPPLPAALSMLAAGIAWGIYSLRGRGASNPTAVTAGNFLRAAPLAILLSLALLQSQNLDSQGVLYALASGAVTSGLGYAIWYAALPHLRASVAATVQLSVPVITTLGGALLLAEPLTLRLLLASAMILGGIALVLRKQVANN
jgi:drug/metabolite transporter (DMT)-like permease